MANNRLIVISWTSVLDTNAIGYNLYLVNGAPPSGTKTLIAFISGVSSNSYNYTAIEGLQYQFEVRATDGINESAPLEIPYPTGQTYATPTNLTPDGKPMMVVRDTQYITSQEFFNYANGLNFNVNSPIYTSGQLDLYLKTASGIVNRYCRRHFDVQTKDEIYPGVRIGQDYPKLMTVFTQEKPIQNIISINLQVLKYYIPVSLDYLMVDPDAGYFNIVPMLGGGFTGYPVPNMLEGLLARVWTRYSFGYDIIPEEVKTATALVASKIITLGAQNPASASQVRFGRNFTLMFSKDDDPIMVMVKEMLSPYRKFNWGRPALAG